MKRLFAVLAMMLITVAACSQRAESKGGVPMSKQELKAKLTATQYEVTQACGTEPPFANAYWDNKEAGIYVDIVSGEPLFSSLDKFDSGTGWPSFTRPIKQGAVQEKADRTHGMERTEVRSQGADSHLGHLFPDGPGPGGQRYCINSAALRFIPAKELEQEGYARYKPLFEPKAAQRPATATFAGGCFWGVEAIFKQIDGVLATTVGYAGGTTKRPTYEEVSTGRTGHAEAIEITFDPNKVSYEKLLDLFFRLHDPTTPNRQGPDVGTQYRSAIFSHGEEQAKAARRMKARFDEHNAFGRPSVTQIVPAGAFFPAEEFHQDYFEKNDQPSCHRLREKM